MRQSGANVPSFFDVECIDIAIDGAHELVNGFMTVHREKSQKAPLELSMLHSG